MTSNNSSNEYLGLDRGELRAIVQERDIEIERLRMVLSNLAAVCGSSWASNTERLAELDRANAALNGDFSKMGVVQCQHCGGENRTPQYDALSGDSSAPETSPKPPTVLHAFDVLREKLRDDPEYAWRSN